jgi:hypothetical protein
MGCLFSRLSTADDDTRPSKRQKTQAKSTALPNDDQQDAPLPESVSDKKGPKERGKQV